MTKLLRFLRPIDHRLPIPFIGCTAYKELKLKSRLKKTDVVLV